MNLRVGRSFSRPLLIRRDALPIAKSPVQIWPIPVVRWVVVHRVCRVREKLRTILFEYVALYPVAEVSVSEVIHEVSTSFRRHQRGC